MERCEPTAHPKVLRCPQVGYPRARSGRRFDDLDALVAVGATGDHEAQLGRPQLDVLRRLDPVPARATGVTDEPTSHFHSGRASDGAERDAVIEVLDSGWLTTGARTAAFEEAFAAYVGTPHAVAV